ncbi:MAG: type II toxin-antitoxin system RelE/ParE family toxin [Bacteroidales bacterium]|nr:type II toxin-antitoxin system RelE/ParE family toxin [Bacteroidales bacterium]
MVKIIWTGRSLKDLEEIGEYIFKDSPNYAKLTLEKLIETAKLIEFNQLIGRVVPEVNQKDIRELITGNYRIIYQTKDKEYANILTVHHSSRLLSNNPAFKKSK